MIPISYKFSLNIEREIVNCDNDVQPPNTFSPIIKTDEGILKLFNDEHLQKANESIDFKDEERTTSSKFMQKAKVDFLILWTFCGIFICFNDLQALKALAPIKVTDEGISMLSKDEQLRNA